MTEIIDNSQRKDAQLPPEPARRRLWPRLVAFAILAAVLAFFAVCGASTVYCGSFAGTLIWTLYVSFLVPVAALVDQPGYFLTGLAAYAIAVVAVARFTHFKLTWTLVAIAVATIYVLSAAVTWVSGGTGGTCTFW